MATGINIILKNGRTLTLDEYKDEESRKEINVEYQEESSKFRTSLPRFVSYRRPLPKDKVVSTRIIFSRKENEGMAESLTREVIKILIKNRDKYLTTGDVVNLLSIPSTSKTTASSILGRVGRFLQAQGVLVFSKERGKNYFKFKPDVKEEQIDALAESFHKEFNKWISEEKRKPTEQVESFEPEEVHIPERKEMEFEVGRKTVVELRVSGNIQILFGLLR